MDVHFCLGHNQISVVSSFSLRFPAPPGGLARNFSESQEAEFEGLSVAGGGDFKRYSQPTRSGDGR